MDSCGKAKGNSCASFAWGFSRIGFSRKEGIVKKMFFMHCPNWIIADLSQRTFLLVSFSRQGAPFYQMTQFKLNAYREFFTTTSRDR